MLDPNNSDSELRAELRETRIAIEGVDGAGGLMGRLGVERRNRRRMGWRIVLLAVVLSAAQYGYARHNDSETCIRGDNYRAGQLQFADVQTEVYGQELHATQAQIDETNARISAKAAQVQRLHACAGILPWTYNTPEVK